MNFATLALPNLPPHQAEMRTGGLYWLTCDLHEDADLLSRQLLAGLPPSSQAVLVSAGGSATTLIEPMPPAAGPARLTLYDLPARRPLRMLHCLRDDMLRVRGGRNSLWLLRVSLNEGEAPPPTELVAWCHDIQQRLKHMNSVLLVVSDGQAASVVAPLLTSNTCASGLGQLFRAGEEIHYLQHFWCSNRGVCGPHDFLLSCDGGPSPGEQYFRVLSSAHGEETEAGGNDQRLYLAMAESLQGSVAPSPEWVLFKDAEELLQRALSARAATVLLPLDSSEAIDTAAARLYQLREHCGRSLKLVVHEYVPSLRYQDELLLLASGANLIVPAGTPLLRLLAQLDAIQGQRWHRPLADSPATTLKQLRPLDVSGHLSPRTFADAARQMLRNAAGRNISHQLLHLPVLPGLTPEQVLSQVRLRRFGDIACVAGGRLYLFLFACASPAIELALRNIFRLPWKELVAGYETVNGLDLLDSEAFRIDTVPEPRDEPLTPEPRQPTASAFRPPAPTQRSLKQLEIRS